MVVMSKVRKNVTLDEELVDLAAVKLTVPLSTFFNNTLKEHLMTSDELSEVKKEIQEHEASLNVLRPQEARLEQLKVLAINNRNIFAGCHDTLVRMSEVNGGFIGQNQLRIFADNKDLDFKALLKYYKDEGFKITKLADNSTRKGVKVVGIRDI